MKIQTPVLCITNFHEKVICINNVLDITDPVIVSFIHIIVIIRIKIKVIHMNLLIMLKTCVMRDIGEFYIFYLLMLFTGSALIL